MKFESKAQLAMDCPTRWNSIYIMLETAVKFSNVFERMRTDDENIIAYFIDKKLVWRYISKLFNFVMIFQNITTESYI